MPLLLVKEGSLAGEEIAVESEMVVGREGADLVIEDPELSRRHALLRPVDGTVEVEDLGSLNGTWVNGARIVEPVRLEPGDVLRIGLTVIEMPPQPRSAETVLSPAATVVSSAATVASQVPVVRVPVLVLTGGPLTGERVPVRAELSLGREDVDVEIDDEELSRRHLLVRPVGETVEIEDLGSRNGTWLNGARITERATLSQGDVVRVGATVIELDTEASSARGEAPAVRAPAAVRAPSAPRPVPSTDARPRERNLERQHLLFILGSVLIIVHIIDVAFFAAQSAQSGLVEYLLTAVVVLVGVLFRRLPPALVGGVGLMLGIIFSGGGIDHIRLWVTDGASPGDYTGIVELLGGMVLIYVSATSLLRWRRQRTATTGAA